MTEPEPVGSIQVSKGDPVFAIWCWRADSITLARLRGPLGVLVQMANTPCEHAHRPMSCPATGERENHWCWPCRLRKLVSAMDEVARPRTNEA